MIDLMISQFLDTNGDGTGTFNAAANHSVTPETYFIKPGPDRAFVLSRMIVYVRDTGSIDAEGFGNASALTNGLVIRQQSDTGTVIDLTAQEPIKSNAGFANHCYDATVLTWGTGDEILVSRWTFANSGTVINLNGNEGDRFEAVVSDDLSTMVDVRFLVQGYRTDIRDT